jgi:hypothetical protein
MTIPPEAISAAAEAITRELMSGKDYSLAIDSDEALAKAALEAAAPLIAAAERDRIRQLALEHAAHFDCDPAWGTPFADLLADDQPSVRHWWPMGESRPMCDDASTGNVTGDPKGVTCRTCRAQIAAVLPNVLAGDQP